MASRTFDLAGGRWLSIYFWIYVAFLYVPLVVLAVFSFHDSPVLALPWRGFSFRWYGVMLQTPGLLNSLRISLIVATLSGACAAILGSLTAVAVVRFRFPGSNVLAAVALVPLVIPALGLAIALLLTFVALGLQPALPTLIVGHAIIGIPSVLLLVATRVVGIDPALEEAAMDLGARWRRVLIRVYLPLLRPALIAGFIAAFVVSFNDFYLADFLAGPDTTLPLYFFSGFRSPDLMPPTLALMSTVTVAMIFVLLFAQVGIPRIARVMRFKRSSRPS